MTCLNSIRMMVVEKGALDVWLCFRVQVLEFSVRHLGSDVPAGASARCRCEIEIPCQYWWICGHKLGKVRLNSWAV